MVRPQDNDDLDLMTFVDEWSRCISTVNQMGVYYRQGSFDPCSAEWQDMKTAIRAKFQGSHEKSRQLLAETHYAQRSTNSPTVGIVWNLKDKPGWGIN